MKRAKRKGEGRPTKLTQEILDLSINYLKECKDEYEKVVKQANEEKGYEMYENKYKVNLPSVAGLARYLRVGRRTIYDWASNDENNQDELNKEFSHILEDLLAEQEKRLLDNGLSSHYNSNITKLLLTKHGYTDKTDVTSDGKAIVTVIKYGNPDSTTP